MGIYNTPLRPGTCDPSKYRCNFPTVYVWLFEKQSRFRPLRGRGVGVCDTPLQSDMYDPSKYRCNFSTGHLCSFKKLSCFHPLRGRGVGRIQYAPTAGYVRSFEILMPFPNWVRMALQKTVLHPPPSVADGGAYVIRPYNRVRTALRNTDAISQLDTYGTSKNCLVSVPFGAAGWGVFNTPL